VKKTMSKGLCWNLYCKCVYCTSRFVDWNVIRFAEFNI